MNANMTGANPTPYSSLSIFAHNGAISLVSRGCRSQKLLSRAPTWLELARLEVYTAFSCETKGASVPLPPSCNEPPHSIITRTAGILIGSS